LFPKNVLSGASLATVALLCCVAFAARAGEQTDLDLDLLVEQDYDSNIFAQESNTQGSPVTVVRPALRLENTGTFGHARLDGWISSHTFWQESKLDGVDRGVTGDFDRTILPRLSVFGDGSYQRVAPHSEIRGPDVVTISGGAPGVPGEPVISPGQLIEGDVPNVDLGQGQFGVRYLLTPRSKLTLSGGPFTIDYLSNPIGRTDLRDRNGWFGSVGFEHALTALDTLTVELGANSTAFDNAIQAQVPIADPFDPHTVDVNTGKVTSDQLSLSLGWRRTWSELWTTSVSLGGRRLRSDTRNSSEPVTRVSVATAGGQPPDSLGLAGFTDYVPTNFSDVGPLAIGEITIERVLPRGRAFLSYSRETRTTSSLATNNVNVDTASLSYVHRLSERATFTLYGAFEHYQSADKNPSFSAATYTPDSFNPITGPAFTCTTGTLVEYGSGPNKSGQCRTDHQQTLVSDSWNAAARLDWQLKKRLYTFVVLRYVDRTGDAQLFGNPFNKFNVGVGFRYDYGLGF
jgi:hypothetical protein